MVGHGESSEDVGVTAPESSSRTSVGSSRWRWLRRIGWLSWVVAVTLLVVPLVPAGQHEIGPGVVSLELGPAPRGATTLSLPPLGRVRAHTHPAPVQVTAELRELDVQPVIAGGGRLDVQTIEAEVRRDLPGAVVSALVRLVAIGAMLGGLAAAVLPHRRLRSIASGALVGAATVGLAAASLLIGFDAHRFEEPTYDGSLALGGPLLAAITSGSASGLDARVDVLAQRLTELYSASTTAVIAGSEGDVAILHVSDIHLNPIGVNLTRELARSLEVDAIVDTGDTTSFGLPIEEPFSDLFDDFGVPYYFVAGNHDSMANRRAISAAPGVTAIGGEVVEVEGVRILGFDDPVITTVRTVPRQERARIMQEAEPDLEALVASEDPDVVAMHNPAMADVVAGQVPVVIAGHLHRTVTSADDGTVVAVVGSTGATGLGSLTVEADEPYLAQVLRFDGRELVAIDNIELIGTSGNFVVRRTLIDDAFSALDPDPLLEDDPEEPTVERRSAGAVTTTSADASSPGRPSATEPSSTPTTAPGSDTTSSTDPGG